MKNRWLLIGLFGSVLSISSVGALSNSTIFDNIGNKTFVCSTVDNNIFSSV